MNSIDNLREYVLTAPSVCSTTRAILIGYIDGIEREVADMVPLPVDADGVPIHVGDVMERAIIAMWRYGVPSSHIARRLNVPRREVNRIIRRQVRHG